MAKKSTTKVKGVAEALRAVKGGKKTTKRKPTKKKSAAKATKKRTSTKKKGTTKRASTKAAKTDKPSSGQSGPSLDLPVEKISAKEMKIVEVLDGEGAGTREIWTIDELAEECFKSKSKKQGNSWVRNSLRRLVRGNVVEKVERGQYRISDSGRKKLARSEAA